MAAVDLSTLNQIIKIDLESLDMGIAIQLVQGQSATLFENQMKDQMREIQERNRKIGDLNTALSSARELLSAFGEKDGTDKKISDVINSQRSDVRGTDEWKAENNKHREKQEADKTKRLSDLDKAINQAQARLTNAGNLLQKNPMIFFLYATDPMRLTPAERQYAVDVSSLPGFKAKREEISKMEIKDLVPATKAEGMLEKLKAAGAGAGLQVDVGKKSDLQTLVENIKTLIDSLSNDQQQDMLRLQSYTNKYNETVEVRTNSIKKEHETNSRILNQTGS